MRTADGKLIESVYMPDEAGPDTFDPEEEVEPGRRIRRTLCVSPQVGGPKGCGFCLPAPMGLVRDLTPGEIADQVYRVNADLRALRDSTMDAQRPLTNLVYMGMGEPLHNYDNVKRSLDLLLDEQGANFSHRHVTVSTSGLVPNIRRLGEATQGTLAPSPQPAAGADRPQLRPADPKRG